MRLKEAGQVRFDTRFAGRLNSNVSSVQMIPYDVKEEVKYHRQSRWLGW
jgi:hypothetical protein